MKLASCSYLVFVLFAASAATAGSINLYPDRDATLIEHPHGEIANGAGPALFVGRTAQSSNGLRRALLHFNVADVLPENAIIEDVSLRLHLTQSNPAPSTIRVHRVLDDWSEGPSSSSGGGGAPAQTGDATWLHTTYNVAYWKRLGGHFVAATSSETEVGPSDTYVWPNTPRLLADVRLWLHAPDQNFGWILLGDESTPQSVKRFDSRETLESGFLPELTIHYRLPDRP